MSTNRPPATFITAARRRQIIDAAVDVLAREGLSQTSLSRIAAQAGLSSPSLITYHFADKDEVFTTLAAGLVDDCAAVIEHAVHAAGPDPAARFEAYVRSFLGWQDEHRREVAALWRLATGWRAPGSDRAFDDAPLVEPLRSLLRAGQESGAFRGFDLETVTVVVVCAVEGFRQAVAAVPSVRAAAYAEELIALFGPGLRADAAPGATS